MSIKTAWPYDADQNDPLTKLRIPVTTSHPSWCYLVAFDRDSAARPTDAEVRMIISLRDEYIDSWYSVSYKAKVAERPFDIDGGANGTVLRKYGPNDWGYRKSTWRYGPTYVPVAPRLRKGEFDLGPFTLEAVMDHIYEVGGEVSKQWLQWKAAHPDVFTAA